MLHYVHQIVANLVYSGFIIFYFFLLKEQLPAVSGKQKLMGAVRLNQNRMR